MGTTSKSTIDLTEANRMLESATAMVALRRKAIADSVTDPDLTVGVLADFVNKLAEAEGALRAIGLVQRVLAYNESRDLDRVSVRDDLIEALLRGASDTWSGRGNDVNRAEFDGFRAQADRLLRGL